MQVVIDIPEKLYNRMKTYQGLDDTYVAVKHGIPLSKGHGRLKDVDRFETHDEYDGQGFTKSVYKDDIDNSPTIIEADRESEG